ncbi:MULTISPECIES: hypothetical protein [Brevibacillus]|nr:MULTISPECIES: hypothetical protein [Brevibacillus]EJL46489.1 hypothetical protein PMI08_01108 [Brevibacillus sp. CF112]MBG9567625.1 hypothetical protein [Brevibacillus agri]QHZ58470.1 hypothetical protein M655_024085 [Brevibacillus sp. NSP2.1]
MLSVWMTLLLMASASPAGSLGAASPQATVIALPAAVQEFDAFLQDWRGGLALASLRHPLFDLTRVSGGVSGAVNTIVFSGEAHGAAGEISLVFYSLDGDRIYSPPGTVTVARVDDRHRQFHVAAAIPRVLQGRTGVVQVTFSGEKRASYLLKVRF